MKNDQFTLLPVCHMANDNILLLIEKCGMEGYGIYIALVGEIRLRDDYHVSSEIFSYLLCKQCVGHTKRAIVHTTIKKPFLLAENYTV